MAGVLHEPAHPAQREAAKIEQQHNDQAQQNSATRLPANAANNAGQAAATQPAPGAGEAAAPSETSDAFGSDRRNAARQDRNAEPLGSINLTGARLDDLSLKDYHETVDKNSPIIQLLNPAQLKDGYFAELGYSAAGGKGDLPGPDTVWKLVEGNRADAVDAR